VVVAVHQEVNAEPDRFDRQHGRTVRQGVRRQSVRQRRLHVEQLRRGRGSEGTVCIDQLADELVVVLAEDVAVLQEAEVFLLDAPLNGRRHPTGEQALLLALLKQV